MRPVAQQRFDFARERAVLERTFLFCGLSRGEIARAARHPGCVRKTAEKGEVVYSPERFERSLGILLEGEARVSKGELIVSVLRSGDVFGAAALWSEEAFAATVTAQSRCRILFFPQPVFSALLAENPGLNERYIRYLSGRIRFLAGKIEGLVAPSTEQRLEQYLLANAREGRVRPECTMTELAKRLNISRASLYRALGTLEKDGVLRREGKEIHLRWDQERERL